MQNNEFWLWCIIVIPMNTLGWKYLQCHNKLNIEYVQWDTNPPIGDWPQKSLEKYVHNCRRGFFFVWNRSYRKKRTRGYKVFLCSSGFRPVLVTPIERARQRGSRMSIVHRINCLHYLSGRTNNIFPVRVLTDIQGVAEMKWQMKKRTFY